MFVVFFKFDVKLPCQKHGLYLKRKLTLISFRRLDVLPAHILASQEFASFEFMRLCSWSRSRVESSLASCELVSGNLNARVSGFQVVSSHSSE
jgi:hypothetical protein